MSLGFLQQAAHVLGTSPRDRRSGDQRIYRVADGLFLYRGFFSNSCVLILPRSVVVVDSQVSPLGGQRLRAAIAQVTSLPVKHVINTHYHGDHTGGNAAFPEAEIIASECTARLMKERDGEREEYARTFGLAFQHLHPTIAPTRTFQGAMRLSIDGEVLELMQIGKVETPDASVVHWPARRAVACGDGVATRDYPFLGVPFLDEGLRGDGSWLAFLAKIRSWEPEYLLPGHGPALTSRKEIADRLDLLTGLFQDLLTCVEEELQSATALDELVTKVDRRLRRYRERPDLRESTVSQRFAIYRCVNSLMPGRKGRGWWHDLRPSVIEKAGAEETERELARGGGAEAVRRRAAGLAREGRRALAISLLESWLQQEPGDPGALGLLSDILFDGARGVRPSVDATEYLAAATQAARRALALDPGEPLALLNLGASEVFGGMVLAQPMESGISKIEAAFRHGGLTSAQRRKGNFFLGKAHQMEFRDKEADAFLRQALPGWLQPFYPLMRNALRAYP